jgi:hypothetical protein
MVDQLDDLEDPLLSTLDEPPLLTVKDLDTAERKAAEWIGERFKESGEWPTAAEAAVFCFQNAIPINELEQNRRQAFVVLDEGRGERRMALAAWVVSDLGIASRALKALTTIYSEALVKMVQAKGDVRWTSQELFERFKIEPGGPAAKQLIYLAERSQMHVLRSSTDALPSIQVPFRLLRVPTPTVDEVFLHRPKAPPWVENLDSPFTVDNLASPYTEVLTKGPRRGWRDSVRKRPTDWVFVASTWEDLREYREKVLWAVLGQKRLPLGMEFWAPDGSRSVERSLNELAQANLMILIVGCRYGMRAREEDERSFIEVEYDTAKQRGIDVLVFLSAVSVNWPQNVWDENQARLKDFRARLEKETMVYYFSSPDDLRASVGQGLRDWDARRAG